MLGATDINISTILAHLEGRLANLNAAPFLILILSLPSADSTFDCQVGTKLPDCEVKLLFFIF